MTATAWFLTEAERDNPDTAIDRRHADGRPYTVGNSVELLVHGASYFPILHERVENLRSGDRLFFTDWRGDPDQRLRPEGPGEVDAEAVSSVFARAAERKVTVKGLIWRSHLDRFSFSEQENRHLGEAINAAGGECLRDMRVRPGGSHHQKFVVLRHPDRPEQDVAFVGGIDLCHSRLDDQEHRGDRQRQPMAAVYGDRPPWHDVQLAIQGPAVDDVEWVFRERWDDPTPLTRNPIDVTADVIRREDRTPGSLPAALPVPAPAGSVQLQLLRTYPKRRGGYPFARRGERSVARGYRKAIGRARRLIMVEDQYLWSADIAAGFARALATNSELRLVAVIPLYPDQDGRISKPPNLVGRQIALNMLNEAGGDRVAVYGLVNRDLTPIYVHAKVCVIDDVWACVGSANLNRRSWTHDSELSCAVIDETRDEREPTTLDRFGDGARAFARNLRLSLAAEHLGREPDDVDDVIDPTGMFEAFADSAARLQDWRDRRSGPRPPGQLVPYPRPDLSGGTVLWSNLLYRLIYDPDGRPTSLRRTHRF